MFTVSENSKPLLVCCLPILRLCLWPLRHAPALDLCRQVTTQMEVDGERETLHARTSLSITIRIRVRVHRCVCAFAYVWINACVSSLCLWHLWNVCGVQFYMCLNANTYGSLYAYIVSTCACACVSARICLCMHCIHEWVSAGACVHAHVCVCVCVCRLLCVYTFLVVGMFKFFFMKIPDLYV